MKKTLMALVAFVLVCVCSIDADARGKKPQAFRKRNVVVQYEDITHDGALRQFDKAKWETQREILIGLVDSAEKAYLNCRTIEDLYEVKDMCEIIKHYLNKADDRAHSITVTNALKVLDRKIIQTEAEYKKAKVITRTQNVDYYLDTPEGEN